jgi:hypothetical protein
MLTVSDLHDPAGKGMFSRHGRKLNQYFINLSKEKSTVEGPPNSLQVKKSVQISRKSRNLGIFRSASEQRPRPTFQPFDLCKGRAYFQALETKSREQGSLTEYVYRQPHKKVKVLRNYNLEASGSSCGRLALHKLPEAFRTHHQCPKYLKETQNEPPSMTSSQKCRGFVNFGKQTNRYLTNQTQGDPKSTGLSLTDSNWLIKPPVCRIMVDFRQLKGRVEEKSPINLRRNNYALEIKRALIEPRTDLIVPIFAKNSSQRSQLPIPTCLNSDFLEVTKWQKHTATPRLALRPPNASTRTVLPPQVKPGLIHRNRDLSNLI